MEKISKEISLSLEQLEQGAFFKISNHDMMSSFFMSIVSDGNHWMFVASNGALTAGRKNANFALFPYYTEDKITEFAENIGCKTIFRLSDNAGKTITWEPFSIRNEGKFAIARNLYKSVYGNSIIFEEINEDLKLTFRYQWSSSNEFGFVRTSSLTNNSNGSVSIEVLDGVQSIMPYGVPDQLQANYSNLVDAYKRSELDSETGLGIFALSAIIVDKAEPSEALKANVVWSLGIDKPTYLVSTRQLDAFRNGQKLHQEEDVKGGKGAYFVHTDLTLSAGQQKQWKLVANVNQGPSDVVALIERINKGIEKLEKEIDADIHLGTENLKKLVGSADGLQMTSDPFTNVRHFSNVLFNIMRGGIFDQDYQIDKFDFIKYLKNANKEVAHRNHSLIAQLPEVFTYQDLKKHVHGSHDIDLSRLAIEYLPLKFSRRHGDPSRPWNRFSINTVSEIDGSKILDYEGNWRDIFQNWEALAHAYPEFIDGMISKFLNASTFDGYNPYRVTKGGFDWEVIEPHDPWSYIGYWGDHQIIYLLKFLEFAQDHYPGKLSSYFTQDLFVYANVPYKIKPYDDILKNPKDTIIFDEKLDHKIRDKRIKTGADGALITNAVGEIQRVNFIEKVLATSLAKLSNFIPEGGIWLTTQRPEWNDANNALVGQGVSMVTLYYMRRFFQFFKEVIATENAASVYEVSEELIQFFQGVASTLSSHQGALSGNISDELRKTILDGLGRAGSTYRHTIYHQAFSGSKGNLKHTDLLEFCDVVVAYLEHSIRANKRYDGLYHAYNLMSLSSDKKSIKISHLDMMLEGQVAVLSSKYLKSDEVVSLLHAMRQGPLFREDQQSYLLYPNKELPKFLLKNIIPEHLVKKSALLTKLVTDGNRSIVEKDVKSVYHFNGNFNNVNNLKQALAELPDSYSDLVSKESDLVEEIFESVFNHKAFTGRSGTFFGFEGLGSIYWHMVSKHGLAVAEIYQDAISQGESNKIRDSIKSAYHEIKTGIGAHKSPKVYGAFPTDPYSHTPAHKGAQQPGMTGQVKEDILSRWIELGISVKNGQFHFQPQLMNADEFLKSNADFEYYDLAGNKQLISLHEGQLAFTICQVPVVYQKGKQKSIHISLKNGGSLKIDDLHLDAKTSKSLFERSGTISNILVTIPDQYFDN